MGTGKERANRAFEAMEELGLERKFITPILRELLKVYNSEWSYIEAENYRLLADQAFEQQEKVVHPSTPSSPRKTRASLAASSSAAEKGKKQITREDTRSPEKRPQREPAKPSVEAGKGAPKPPLLAKVKTEKGADGAPVPPVKAPVVVERVDTGAMHDKHEILRSSGTKDRPSACVSVPVSPSTKIDAQTLEETLKRVASTSTEMSVEPRDTAGVSGTHPTVNLLEGKLLSQTRKDNGKTEPALEKVEAVCGKATQQRLPDSCTTNTTNGYHVVQRAAPEPGTGAEPVIVGQPSFPRVVDEKSRWHKPVTDGANVLLLLADNYSEDDEPQVADISVPHSTVIQPSVEERQDEPLLVKAIEPDSSVMQVSSEERHEQPLEPIEIELLDEELPEQPLDMVLSVEEDPEQLDPLESDSGPEHAVETAGRIRPRFIFNKEAPVASDQELNPISILVRGEPENTPSAAKRELSDPQELTQLKRVKYDAEAKASSELANGFIDLDDVGVNSCHVPKDKEKCSTPPCSSKSNVTAAASTSPADSGNKPLVVDITSVGANRRKLIIRDSPSPETSPVAKVHVAALVSESIKSISVPTSAEIVEVRTAASAAPSFTHSGTVSSRSSEVKVSENGVAASIMVNTAMIPDDFDDEPQDSRKKLAHCPADISRGTERVSIPYVNDYNSDTIPASFKYIPLNTVFQDAYVNFSLARVGEEDCCGGCLGDCLKAPYPCTCTRETGGVFAYTNDGLLKDEFLQHEVESSQDEENKEKLVTFCQSGWECPIERAKSNIPENCKGHLSRKFIKECWHKCGCSMDCGNRVVQRGISRRLQIFFTQEGKGWGLRTLEQLPPGAFVCEYVGEILTNIELDKRNSAQKGESMGTHTYPILLDGDWCSEKGLKDEEALCLDATYFGNAARFINHRCLDANLIDMPVTIESPDRHYYHVAFFTSRAVKAMEELTWAEASGKNGDLELLDISAQKFFMLKDYKIDFDDDEHPIEAFRCLCKSPFCRGSTGKKQKKKKLVKKCSY